MLRLFCSSFFCVLIFLCQTAFADPLQPSSQLYEKVYRQKPVGSSTLIVKGLSYEQKWDPRAPQYPLRVWIADNPRENLCVEIVSQDLDYEARRIFNTRGVAPGWRDVPMELTEINFLSRYNINQLAMRAISGAFKGNSDQSCYSDQDFQLIPINWQRGEIRLDRLNALLAVNPKHTVSLSFAGSPPSSCDELNDQISRTAYGARCVLSIDGRQSTQRLIWYDHDLGGRSKSDDFLVILR
jgi:hypothetical protein